MLSEKVRKHARKNTVLVGEQPGYGPKIVGVILSYTSYDRTMTLVGYRPNNDMNDQCSYMYEHVRKATKEEREAFFMWLNIQDKEDVKDIFKLCCGPPRKWKKWNQKRLSEDVTE